jgi:hypothetical protein
LAIENARLPDQKERQRLARELHDSVSHALYGIGLATRAARKLLDREALEPPVRTKLTGPLDHVLSLADAELTEMRGRSSNCDRTPSRRMGRWRRWNGAVRWLRGAASTFNASTSIVLHRSRPRPSSGSH